MPSLAPQPGAPKHARFSRLGVEIREQRSGARRPTVEGERVASHPFRNNAERMERPAKPSKRNSQMADLTADFYCNDLLFFPTTTQTKLITSDCGLQIAYKACRIGEYVEDCYVSFITRAGHRRLPHSTGPL